MHHAIALFAAAFMSESLCLGGLGTIFGLDAFFSLIILWVSFAESDDQDMVFSPRGRQVMIESGTRTAE